MFDTVEFHSCKSHICHKNLVHVLYVQFVGFLTQPANSALSLHFVFYVHLQNCELQLLASLSLYAQME
jgi:hypothetical protein